MLCYVLYRESQVFHSFKHVYHLSFDGVQYLIGFDFDFVDFQQYFSYIAAVSFLVEET